MIKKIVGFYLLFCLIVAATIIFCPAPAFIRGISDHRYTAVVEIISTAFFGGIVSFALMWIQDEKLKLEAFKYVKFIAFHVTKTFKREIAPKTYVKGESVTYLGDSNCIDLGNEIKSEIGNILKYENYPLGEKNNNYRKFLKDIKKYYFLLEVFQTEVNKYNDKLMEFVKAIRAGVKLSSNDPGPDVWYAIRRFYYKDKKKDTREEITEDGKRIEFIKIFEKELVKNKVDKELNKFTRRYEGLKSLSNRIANRAKLLVEN